MKPILEIKNISKKYKLRGQETPYLTIREAIMGKTNKAKNEFWALDDVSFSVNPGDSVGIIGKNGAGKSTLLKILSKITPPTKGEILLRGRIASLLEVGTGFHAELTGMENIFLNGSILGLKKAEIKQKLDEIIDFSGIEKFIETPLKHYSSGMQLRLAFAVAAHLEPEILIIDEVLAVGDAEFQKKSLGKMEDITKQGRTVLFVSHNMPAVQNLCNKGILLQNGKVDTEGDINTVISKYKTGVIQSIKSINSNYGIYDLRNHPNKSFNISYGLQKATLFCDGIISEKMYSGCNLKFAIEIVSHEDYNDLSIGFVIKDADDTNLIGINNAHLGQKISTTKNSHSLLTIEIEKIPLFQPGQYTVNLYLGNKKKDFDIILDALSFELESTDIYNSGNLLDARINKMIVNNIQIKCDA